MKSLFPLLLPTGTTQWPPPPSLLSPFSGHRTWLPGGELQRLWMRETCHTQDFSSLLFWFPMAVVTHDHRLSGLKQEEFWRSEVWSESFGDKIKVLAGVHFFCRPQGRIRFLAFSSFLGLLHPLACGPFFCLQSTSLPNSDSVITPPFSYLWHLLSAPMIILHLPR